MTKVPTTSRPAEPDPADPNRYHLGRRIALGVLGGVVGATVNTVWRRRDATQPATRRGGTAARLLSTLAGAAVASLVHGLGSSAAVRRLGAQGRRGLRRLAQRLRRGRRSAGRPAPAPV
ncbi:MAG TPA: hypothetical protein VGQ83_33995, partial [Polyangia bacterium]